MWPDKETNTKSEVGQGLSGKGGGVSSDTGCPVGPAGSVGARGRDGRGRWTSKGDRNRFLALVQVEPVEEMPGLGPCWTWVGRLTADGYPLLDVGGRPVRAHRWAYEQHYGLVLPDGWTLDHLCHTFSVPCSGGRACLHARCVRPSHLEPLPPGENVRRRHARDRAVRTIQEMQQ